MRSKTVFCPLSEREMQTVRLMAENMTAKEMARSMACAHRTVEVHRRNVVYRLKARNHLHAVVIAMRMGLI